MRVKLEPETAFIGKKFAYIFMGIIFGFNAIVFVWFFFYSKLTWIQIFTVFRLSSSNNLLS